MNFAKNNICLQCDAKRPKRQLLPGEWECPGCNFLNYRRNMACFHCDCKRPLDEYLENKVQEVQRGPRTRMGKTADLHGDANAWNFNFDDNESDGADVAAFEYADSSVRDENSLGNQAQGQDFGHRENNLSKDSRVPRGNNEEYFDADTIRPGRGFDDFDDEDDDIDNYELDTHNKTSAQDASIDLSEFEGSESEDIENSDNSLQGRRRTKSSSYNKPFKPTRQRAAFSVSDDDELDVDFDKELSVHPNWKSSHVADSRSRGRGRTTPGPSKRLSFGSDDELGLSDDDLDQNFGARRGRSNNLDSKRKGFQRRGNFDMEDDAVSGSESDNGFQSHKNRPGRNKENNFKGRGGPNFTRETQFESNGMKGGRRNSSNDDFDGSTRGSRGNNRGLRGNDFDGPRMSNRGDDAHKFKGPRREGFGKQQRGRVNEYGRDKDRGPEEFRNSRRVIER
ncbi:hypothetical protein ACFX2H_033217 [Malus domestica]